MSLFDKHKNITDKVIDRFKNDKITSMDKNTWIKIKDQLPEMHQDVLLFDGNGPIRTIRYTVGSLEKDNIGYAWQTWDVLSDFEQFTHWMPLPEPPKV